MSCSSDGFSGDVEPDVIGIAVEVEWNGVVDGVKSCSEVEEDENAEVTRVSGDEEVLGGFEEGCFCAVL